MMRRTKGETRSQQAERIRQAHEWMDDRRAGTVRLTPAQYREWQQALACHWTPQYDGGLEAAYRDLRSMARTR